MERVRFVVEGCFKAKSRGIVLCRRLEKRGFTLTAASSLGGRPVVAFDMPRKLGPDGSQDYDAFGFTLANQDDLNQFVVGEEVLFENP